MIRIKSNIRLTRHAGYRMKNRSIGSHLIDILYRLGDSRPAGGGAERIFLPRGCVGDVKEEFGADFPKVERFLDGYMILSPDGAVITVAHDRRGRKPKFGPAPRALSNEADFDVDGDEETAVDRKARHRKRPTRH